MADFAKAREQMVDVQIAGRGVRDPALLEAMRGIPRERFVDQGLAQFAHDDTPLPIAEGQTISQPYIVALMLEAAELRPGQRALEIGAGSGYLAALMAKIGAEVYAVERHPLLAEATAARFADLGCRGIRLRVGDGTLGWPEAAPFDVIIVSAGGPGPPPALKRQLAAGGRMIIPTGSEERQQRLLKIVRKSKTVYEEEDLGAVRFVPLIGAQGWGEHGRPTATQHRPARQ